MLINPELLEKMATDPAAREKYESILSGAGEKFDTVPCTQMTLCAWVCYILPLPRASAHYTHMYPCPYLTVCYLHLSFLLVRVFSAVQAKSLIRSKKNLVKTQIKLKALALR